MTTSSETGLDFSRLENIKTDSSGRTTAACPACREQGHDKKGDHLFIGADGKFGCVANAGDHEHRRGIFALVGTAQAPQERAKPFTHTKPQPKPQAQSWNTLEAAAQSCTPKGFAFVKSWQYDDGGTPVGGVARYEHPHQDKTFRQFKAIGGAWQLGAPDRKWPLLGYDAIPPSGPVVLVEGEKARDCASKLGLPVVCAAGGSGAAGKTDFTPLAGRDVWIQPDNDEAGMKFASSVKSILHPLDSKTQIRFVKLPDLPKGGDIVEWVEARKGMPIGELLDQFEETAMAAPIEPVVESELSAITNAPDEEQEEPKAKPKPWEQVTSADVRAAIKGTPLEQIVAVLQAVTNPPLPLEISLPKALVLAGVALSQKAERPFVVTERGIDLARLSIEISGGLGLNVWTCIVAPSASGKDIGNLTQRIAENHSLFLGNGGSAEGVMNELIERGAGLLIIPELQNYLDTKHYLYKLNPFLTSVFNSGSFHESRSTRTKGGGPVDIPFCFPSLQANVQPEILTGCGGKVLIDSGFLPRFLFGHARKIESWRPVANKLNKLPLSEAFEAYLTAEGSVTVPENYLQDVLNEFVDGGALYPSHYSRLINEYGPKFAVMLAFNPHTPTSIVIGDEHWARAGVLVRWFYGMAEGLFTQVGESSYVRKMEGRLERMLEWIKRFPNGVAKGDFSKRFFERGTTAIERDRDLAELESRGLIVKHERGKGMFLRAIK